jgi:FAD/FMN-containing dehydrogenase
MKQLFIGAEGTLGIITAASLRLYPLPRDLQTALVGVASAPAAVALLSKLRLDLDDQLQAFELLPDRAIRLVLRHIPDTRYPFDHPYPWYVLVECAGRHAAEAFHSVLMSAIESGLAHDAVIAGSQREAGELWRLRHAISEAQKFEGASLKHDVSVPLGHVGNFIETAETAVRTVLPGIRVIAFGHVGDGNVHFNISQPKDMSLQNFSEYSTALSAEVYAITRSFGGSISAEHGIGQAKRGLLRQFRSTAELGLMIAVKRALDPSNIMNPGKVL